jgi:hypothetical protein
MKTRDDYSGAIQCSEDSIAYHSAGGGWSVRISDIRLIGEYTTANGPYVDDYFFVFLAAPEGGWHQASYYAKGMEETLRSIEQNFGTPMQLFLCKSTDFKTRIIWPPRLKGRELMEVIPPKKQSLWHKFTNLGVKDIRLSKAALEAFEE